MQLSQGVNYCLEYHRANSKQNIIRSCEFVLSRFNGGFGNRDMDSITADEVLTFLTEITEGKQSRLYPSKDRGSAKGIHRRKPTWT